MPAPQCVPAFPVDAVDTTGCGNGFHGVYAAALAAECEPECVRRESALKATYPGGQGSLPSAHALAAFFAEE